MKVCIICGTTNPINNTNCESCGEILAAPVKIVVTPPREDALPTGTPLNQNRYRILHTVGRGGFAITYRAFDSRHNAYVAIKELFPDGRVSRNTALNVIPDQSQKLIWQQELERFQTEAKILQTIKHPACVAPVDNWQENGTTYLAMEFLSGETLEARIARRGTIYEAEAMKLLDTLLEALVVVHSKGILHRDLKPANIIVIEDYPEIVDFGSARGMSNHNSERILTPAYAPLEQYGRNIQEHPSTDLYSLAATFYEAVIGKPPETALERAQGKDLTPVQNRNPLISSTLAHALEKALQMKLERRYRTANDMRIGLGLPKIRIVDKQKDKEFLDRIVQTFWIYSTAIAAFAFFYWYWQQSRQ